jgi:hypothetical protein
MWRGYNYSKECKKDKRVSGLERLLLMRFLLEEGTRTTCIWGKWR